MMFPSLITLGLALVATATPVVDTGNSLVAQGKNKGNPCDGGRDYCGWYDKGHDKAPTCKCPSGQNWDSKRHECEYPPHPKPKCGPTQKPICARSKDEWCDYDASNDLCKADGTTVIIIIEIEIDITIIVPEIEEECKKPKCSHGQTIGKDGKCHYPCFDEDKAHTCVKKRGTPICAKSPEDFCEFDAKERLCEDDGFNSFHCIEEKEKPEDYLLTVFASLDISLGVFGFDCLCDGLGCILNDDVWGLLCLVCDVTSILCGLLDALLGLC